MRSALGFLLERHDKGLMLSCIIPPSHNLEASGLVVPDPKVSADPDLVFGWPWVAVRGCPPVSAEGENDASPLAIVVRRVFPPAWECCPIEMYRVRL